MCGLLYSARARLHQARSASSRCPYQAPIRIQAYSIAFWKPGRCPLDCQLSIVQYRPPLDLPRCYSFYTVKSPLLDAAPQALVHDSHLDSSNPNNVFLLGFLLPLLRSSPQSSLLSILLRCSIEQPPSTRLNRQLRGSVATPLLR